MLRRIETVLFKRWEDSEWEVGLQLNYGDLGILDKNGNFVEHLWDARDMHDLVIDHLDIILNPEASNKIREEEFDKQEQLKEDDDMIQVSEYSLTYENNDNEEDIKENTYKNIGYTL